MSEKVKVRSVSLTHEALKGNVENQFPILSNDFLVRFVSRQNEQEKK